MMTEISFSCELFP